MYKKYKNFVVCYIYIYIDCFLSQDRISKTVTLQNPQFYVLLINNK